jgi:hypothetical protein
MAPRPLERTLVTRLVGAAAFGYDTFGVVPYPPVTVGSATEAADAGTVNEPTMVRPERAKVSVARRRRTKNSTEVRGDEAI